MKLGFWKIFGIGLGTAAVSSLAVATICHNGKKIRKTFGKKKEVPAEESKTE